MFWKIIQRPLKTVTKIKEKLKRSFSKAWRQWKAVPIWLFVSATTAYKRRVEAIKENKIGAETGKTQLFTAVAQGFKVKASPTQLFLDTSPVIKTLIKRDVNKSSKQTLTLNQNFLSVVKGYTILFIKIPF